MSKKYGKAKKWRAIAISAIVILVLAVVGGVFYFSVGGEGVVEELTPQEVNEKGEGVQYTKELGAAATIELNAYTGSWGKAGSSTEVYPVYTITDGDGTVFENDVGVNSSTKFSVGDTMMIYPTGASYYFAPLTFNVNQAKDTVPDIQAHAVVATTDLVITCYDADTESTELTADDNDNNTADYNGGNIGADETNAYLCKLKNNVADKEVRIGAIMTYYCGDEADDYTLEDDNWEETNFPIKGITKKAFYHYDDTNTSTSCNFKHVYIPKEGDYVVLYEWQDTGKMQFVFDGGSTQPAANGDTYFGHVYVDYSCEKNKDGKVECGWYKNDDNGDPGEIGLDEAPETSGYNSLDVGVAIEPQ